MTKVIWLGEDTEIAPGPSFNIWNGVKFPKDVAVEVTDPYMLDKLRKLGDNRFYKMIEERKQENSHGESQTQEQVKEQTEVKEQKDQGTGYSPVKKKVRKKKPPVQDSAGSNNPAA